MAERPVASNWFAQVLGSTPKTRTSTKVREMNANTPGNAAFPQPSI
eukprot:CAMPEP_0172724362 /NCGR_PEP_ID=MMETSP1074-20121228/85796_1 /TAXON_ID=2916 /ORGANISM="Ceratium fusus, Strain PA161109" /LENGTH=45 /DNA_ID= /DNA_START= /DNA_END= /DNA_ORIENTATION=